MKIICFGRNYTSHAKELNNEILKKPFFFIKPDTSLLRTDKFYLPSFSNNINYEVELAIKINKIGKSIHKKFAHKYYNEISLGIDFTARDLQNDCKNKKLPWDISKSFDYSTPIGKWFEKSELSSLEFKLLKNNKIVQKGNPDKMIFKIDELIQYLTNYITVKKGDIILTGTPSGVGKIFKGDRLVVYLDNKKTIEIDIF